MPHPDSSRFRKQAVQGNILIRIRGNFTSIEQWISYNKITKKNVNEIMCWRHRQCVSRSNMKTTKTKSVSPIMKTRECAAFFLQCHHRDYHYIHLSCPIYSRRPNTTPTIATAMPAPRLTLIAPALFLFVLVEDEAEVELVAVAVPFCCLAAAWNAAKLLGPDSIAFTLKTIPAPQWLAYTSKDQLQRIVLST